jgi:hypothetical protein
VSAETEKMKIRDADSRHIQFRWMMGKISKLIGVPKKQLRRALKIIKAPRVELETLNKQKKPVRKIFTYGFSKFHVQGKKKKREICEPHPVLQEIYQAIKIWLDENFAYHDKAYGFVRGRNPERAVRTLMGRGKKHFIAFDIARAFPSIEMEMVKKTLVGHELEEPVAEALAWLVTYFDQKQRCLPQGASSSPALLNLVYKPMCEEIEKICRKKRIRWAVYADDFNFAAGKITAEAKTEILAVPQKFGFTVKEEKNKDNHGKTIPHLLGLTIVERKIHISRRRKKEYRRIFFEALKHENHSANKVKGIANAIRCIYGEEKNWPGWLLKPWQEYKEKTEGQ